ncbi:exported hypothetical protein [Vibrio nigripulchritudo FTn2]|uniref:hypothetical protein n=1 Tax=Vibrio nigripulchritudo TaxID=28173 RepID=UPI0003B22FDE|nr:hypothetical protein [Vibrio nigripulchritudo]CCN39706.1 exported hypothetical protein [Vibrio nigripulchritudo FTn2]
MKKSLIATIFSLFTSSVIASGFPVISADKVDELNESLSVMASELSSENNSSVNLKHFCFDANGNPGLVRKGYVYNYVSEGGIPTISPRLNVDGTPMRCMTKAEFEKLFSDDVYPGISYWDE